MPVSNVTSAETMLPRASAKTGYQNCIKKHFHVVFGYKKDSKKDAKHYRDRIENYE